MKQEIRDCFKSAIKDEKKGKKHKGLLITKPDNKIAEEYLAKAKKNLELCDIYRKTDHNYKIPEEWFYTLYYCALAILAMFGLESRSQKCTATFLRYVKDSGLIDYDDDFINRITVYKRKEEISDVDERERSRYGSSLKSEEISAKYEYMMNLCKKAISQCEEIVFSDKKLNIPKEMFE